MCYGILWIFGSCNPPSFCLINNSRQLLWHKINYKKLQKFTCRPASSDELKKNKVKIKSHFFKSRKSSKLTLQNEILILSTGLWWLWDIMVNLGLKFEKMSFLMNYVLWNMIKIPFFKLFPFNRRVKLVILVFNTKDQKRSMSCRVLNKSFFLFCRVSHENS